MTETPDLDRAIEAALEAHKMSPAALNHQMRVFVRNIVAELLRGMEKDLGDPVTSLAAIVYRSGFNDVLAEIRRRAGLEGEG